MYHNVLKEAFICFHVATTATLSCVYTNRLNDEMKEKGNTSNDTSKCFACSVG